MTRRDQAHRIPSNARYTRGGTYETREWMQADPDYDDPLEWRELRDPWLWIGAVLMVLAVGAFCVLVFAIVPAPR